MSGSIGRRLDDEPDGASVLPTPRSRRAGVVLVADDSRDTRELYVLHLNYCGFTAYTAFDGISAIEMAVSLRPDVIVMDLSMPGVDGIDAIRRLKSNPRTRKIPVILLTGYPAKAIERGAMEAGASVFLTKPCLPEDLEQQVRQLLDDQRSR
jgi:two-component system, cell cycle response regulator DivK